MPAVQGAHLLDKITCQWQALADRRLAYFIELYQSGRWKHYYTRERFALRMLDALARAPAEQFLVVVECADEAQQRELLVRFHEEGLRCQAKIA